MSDMTIPVGSVHTCAHLQGRVFVSYVIKLHPDDTVVVVTNLLALSLVRVFVELRSITYSLPREGCWTQDGNYLIMFIIQLPLLGHQISFWLLVFSQMPFSQINFPQGHISRIGNTTNFLGYSRFESVFGYTPTMKCSALHIRHYYYMQCPCKFVRF